MEGFSFNGNNRAYRIRKSLSLRFNCPRQWPNAGKGLINAEERATIGFHKIARIREEGFYGRPIIGRRYANLSPIVY